MEGTNKFTIGFIVNPISGMGGSVGLKGTDGEEILQRAIELGAEPNARNRAREFLKELLSLRPKLNFITCPGNMGASILEEFNYFYDIISHPLFNDKKDDFKTNAEHTIVAAENMKKEMN